MHVNRENKDIRKLNEKLISDFAKFRDVYYKNKILLEKKHCELIDNIIRKTSLAKVWQSHEKFMFDERYADKVEDSVRLITEEIPSMRESLEAAFRKILGVK